MSVTGQPQPALTFPNVVPFAPLDTSTGLLLDLDTRVLVDSDSLGTIVGLATDIDDPVLTVELDGGEIRRCSLNSLLALDEYTAADMTRDAKRRRDWASYEARGDYERDLLKDGAL